MDTVETGRMDGLEVMGTGDEEEEEDEDEEAEATTWASKLSAGTLGAVSASFAKGKNNQGRVKKRKTIALLRKNYKERVKSAEEADEEKSMNASNESVDGSAVRSADGLADGSTDGSAYQLVGESCNRPTVAFAGQPDIDHFKNGL